MNPNLNTNLKWSQRLLVALIFLGLGSLIMVVFSPWSPPLEKVLDYLGRLGLIFLLGVFAWVVKRSPRLEKYWQLLYGLLVLTVATSLAYFLARYLIEYLGVRDTIPAEWAILKMNEFLVVICVVLIFTRLSGNSLGSIYIQKGNLKLGLSIGLILFLLAAAGSIPMATLFKAPNLTLARILPWTPWLLIYVLANAAMEEVMFRGLFIRKLEPFLGKWISNILIAVVFTGIHGLTTYSADQMIFLLILFPLALSWGYLIQRTDALWASILFHAGMDIPIMLGIFANL